MRAGITGAKNPKLLLATVTAMASEASMAGVSSTWPGEEVEERRWKRGGRREEVEERRQRRGGEGGEEVEVERRLTARKATLAAT